MKSSLGSNAFALLSLLVVSILVLLLLRHFLPLRTTPSYLLVPVFLAIALPASVVLLVPIDLTSSLRSDDEAFPGIWLPQGVILVAWRIAYWLTFALTWFILPLLGEYVDSGYRTPKSRIVYSLRSNGRFQLIVLACSAVGLGYVLWQTGFAKTSAKALVMALSYCWGLIVAISLMGHGLVAVPRKLYRDADVRGRLKRIQGRAPKIYDSLNDTNATLEELEAQLAILSHRKYAISSDHQEWIEDISGKTMISEARPPPSAFGTSSPTIPAVITDRYLAELSRKLNRARHRRVRFVDTWNRLVQEAVNAQAILDASASKRLIFRTPSPHANFLESISIVTPYTRYLLHVYVIPAVRKAFAALFSFASLCIVWSELIKFVAPQLSIIRLTVVTNRRSGGSEVGFIGQVSASIWILYMFATVLASFDDVKIWGNRALVRRNTYGESATWYSGQIARLAVPLAYNFVTFLPPELHRKTRFYQFLGRLVNLTPLGKGFDYFFPILILMPVCATLFNLYGRVQGALGFGLLENENEEGSSELGSGSWREGRALIEQETNGTSRLGHSIGIAGKSSKSSFRSQRDLGNGGLSRSLLSSPPTSSTAIVLPGQPPGPIALQERQAQRLANATQAGEEVDETFFQGFAHRLRNTFDNVEGPDWLSELGKRPKWMGGSDGGSEGSGRMETGRSLGRWFGGRPTDGRVRL